ncbi:MBL fold metallo-hydrolase [Paraflavitalea sp. CAU 1676]|uniref:MBL fold metallo-hydrolase n=1 Tax=Paraflavitalea sp. CAU 1676 TaxID=3032598 RepID=UPI0023DB2F8F|nr:MBL fold metallo-hydrolase [Paraflavitalea sp. CAU 1676]MDF2188559.1 MBL fold metallo-hydrolase [Paraflavitalea sp. CAU 1676]
MSVLQPARKQGNKFLNPVPTKVMSEGSMVSVLGAYITNKNEVVPRHLPGPFHTDVSAYKTPPATGLRITWIGHSSLLIEIDGKRLLTDPVWSKRASFSSFIGPKRFFAPPIALQDLPPLDAIIISHDHYDHLDAPTIRFFADKAVPFFCSLNVGRYLQQYGIAPNRITEMDWTNQVTLGSDCTITALPARHFSGRGLFNRFTTLWSSFAIRTPRHHIYYGADSGLYSGFADIGAAYGPFDLTMLEIGASNTYWADIHMGPIHAAEAHLALKGKLMMPIHWGTFNLALHPWQEPIETLIKLAAEKGISLFAPQPGEPVAVSDKPYINTWWKR